eukprot:5463172-Alexandrium_andersonii.AAC.1
MSASLVGSEMCIRDRSAEPAADPTLPPRARAAHPGRGRAGACAPRRPVSYTHLTLPTICSV